MFKLGKTPARPGAIKLRFGTYFSAAELPAVPLAFGHPWLVQAWRMLGNDLYGAFGRDFATASSPMLPPAPALFSTTKFQWVSRASLSARLRETVSVPPPGVKGTTKRMG